MHLGDCQVRIAGSNSARFVRQMRRAGMPVFANILGLVGVVGVGACVAEVKNFAQVHVGLGVALISLAPASE